MHFFLLYKPLQYHKAENFFFFDYKRTLVRLKASETDINPDWHLSHHSEVPQWEIFLGTEIEIWAGFGLDLGWIWTKWPIFLPS